MNVYLFLGVKKSGTTDFMSKIRKHPEYCAPLFGKESQWISRRRFGIRVSKRETCKRIVVSISLVTPVGKWPRIRVPVMQ